MGGERLLRWRLKANFLLQRPAALAVSNWTFSTAVSRHDELEGLGLEKKWNSYSGVYKCDLYNFPFF